MHSVCPITQVYGEVIPMHETGLIDRKGSNNPGVNEFLHFWDVLAKTGFRSKPETWKIAKRGALSAVSESHERLLFLLARDRYHSVRKCCEREVMKPVGGGHLTGTCCTELRYMDTIIYQVKQWKQ
ncbi:hypothetical protein FGIG_04649 [Fasciola gigantica]|uniref:Uncharacterized protein n=1 Tax=Fasciola gigantica TaxID=46835 RepID=A0A504YB59_FASGI|nr:hypothetical protein FGIG_04649 [Fasciola gigantica]